MSFRLGVRSSLKLKQIPPAIPKISSEELTKRHDRVRFVGKFTLKDAPEKAPVLHYLEKRPADHGFWLIRGEEEANDIELLTTITTYHYLYIGSPDPSISEYLSQIPDELLSDVDVIEVYYKEFERTGDFWALQTNLYRKKKV